MNENDFGISVENVLDLMIYKKFSINFYQRKYSWGIDNITPFLEYFLTNNENSENNNYTFPQTFHIKDVSNSFELIDGQQRYITTKLLCLAIYELISNEYDEDFLGIDICDNRPHFIKLKELIFSKFDRLSKELYFKKNTILYNGDESKYNLFLDNWYKQNNDSKNEENFSLLGNIFYDNYKTIYNKIFNLTEIELINMYHKFINTYYILRNENGPSYELFKNINISALPLELFEIIKSMLIRNDNNIQIESHKKLKQLLIDIENNFDEIYNNASNSIESHKVTKEKSTKYMLVNFLSYYYLNNVNEIKPHGFDSFTTDKNYTFIKIIENILEKGDIAERIKFSDRLNNYLKTYIEFKKKTNSLYISKIKYVLSLDMLNDTIYPYLFTLFVDLKENDTNELNLRIEIIDNIIAKYLTMCYLNTTSRGSRDLNYNAINRFYKFLNNKKFDVFNTYLCFFGKEIENNYINLDNLKNSLYINHTCVRKVLISLNNRYKNPSLEHILPQSYNISNKLQIEEQNKQFDKLNGSLGNVFNNIDELKKSIYSLGNFVICDLGDNQSLSNFPPYQKINKMNILNIKYDLDLKYLNNMENKTFAYQDIKELTNNVCIQLEKHQIYEWDDNNLYFKQYKNLINNFRKDIDTLQESETKEDVIKTLLNKVSFDRNNMIQIGYNLMKDEYELNKDNSKFLLREDVFDSFIKLNSSIIDEFKDKISLDEIKKILLKERFRKNYAIENYYEPLLKKIEDENIYMVEFFLKGDSKKINGIQNLFNKKYNNIILQDNSKEHKIRIVSKVSF